RYVVLADAYESGKDIAKAKEADQAAIAAEPKNPFFLRRYFEFQQRMGDETGARKTAEQLVESETSDYFKFTALPWLVNTDTVEARIYLAANGEPELLQGAFDILLNYRKKTYSELLRLTGLSMVEEEEARNQQATHM